eukprot:3859452-Rhodomonas_salina.1
MHAGKGSLPASGLRVTETSPSLRVAEPHHPATVPSRWLGASAVAAAALHTVTGLDWEALLGTLARSPRRASLARLFELPASACSCPPLRPCTSRPASAPRCFCSRGAPSLLSAARISSSCHRFCSPTSTHHDLAQRVLARLLPASSLVFYQRPRSSFTSPHSRGRLPGSTRVAWRAKTPASAWQAHARERFCRTTSTRRDAVSQSRSRVVSCDGAPFPSVSQSARSQHPQPTTSTTTSRRFQSISQQPAALAKSLQSVCLIFSL